MKGRINQSIQLFTYTYILTLVLFGCNGNPDKLEQQITPQEVHRVEVRQSLENLYFDVVISENKNLNPQATRIDTGIDYLVSNCSASQVDSKWRTCCDVRITNNTGGDLSGVILIGWQELSGYQEAARSGGNNTGFDGSGTGWRTIDGVNPNPTANGGWALWFKHNGVGNIPAGATSEPRRICLQSPSGYSASIWYLYVGCPSGKVANANNYSGLKTWAMLGDQINDPNYPELGSGNYVYTDSNGYFVFPEITASTFILNSGANCFNNQRVVTGFPFEYVPLSPACFETFIPNDDATDSILVFDHTDTGNIPPLRNITGGATQLNNPHRVAVDTVNDEIVVANFGNNSITVYARLGKGNVTPLRVIQGLNTTLNNPEDVAIDTEHDEIFVANKKNNSIIVFSRTATGNVSPLRTISGANTRLNNNFGIAVDYINNEIFVANDGTDSILVFPREGNGNIPPLREIIGPASGILKPRRPAVDPVNDELIVPEQSNNSILIFSRTANGNVAPIRIISGALTTIVNPEGVAVDTINNEILIGNKGGFSLLAFSRTVNGNVAPLRNISGPNTLITNPFGPGVSY